MLRMELMYYTDAETGLDCAVVPERVICFRQCLSERDGDAKTLIHLETGLVLMSSERAGALKLRYDNLVREARKGHRL